MQEGLTVKTLGGTEIAVQTILRVDHEFVALRGRLAGTQEAGRFFFLPYTQIDYLGYQKDLMEADFKAIFETLAMPAPAAAAGDNAPESAEGPTREAAGPPAESPPDAAAAASERGTPTPLKSAVLERFRSRSLSNVNPGPRSSAG